MSNYIDIHNHMAWGIDDGMDCKENAKIALANARKDGVTSIIATPHYVPAQYDEIKLTEIIERIKELKALASDYEIEIYTGAELFLNSEYLDMLDEHQCPSLAESKYLLCEFDVRKEMNELDSVDVEEKLYEIKVRGYVPVIAHVERYFHKKLDVDRIKEWIHLGCMIQVNRTSLLGLHGSTCEDHARSLIEKGLVHVIASDTHRCNGDRICKFSDAYEYLKKQYGEDCAEILCKRNPAHIIKNEELETITIEKKSILKRLFGRS